jgi:hypothetical protein
MRFKEVAYPGASPTLKHRAERAIETHIEPFIDYLYFLGTALP